MELRLIGTEADYQQVLQEIELLFDAAPNTPECDRLDILLHTQSQNLSSR